MKDFYYILGTDSNCTPGEISDAYHKLAKKLQPSADEEDNFLQSHFREISEAYEILSDPARRRVYDAALSKNHKRQVANFKTRHINIVATGIFLLFTAVFGFYVIKIVNRPKPVEAVKPVIASVAVPHKIKHHKRKQHTKIVTPMAAAKPVAVKKDTVAKVAIVKPAPAKVVQPTVNVQQSVAKVQPVIAKVQAPIVTQPPVARVQPVVANRTYARVDSSYTTSLKDNLAGSVYLHQLADYMSAVVTVLPHNSKLRVLEKGQSFYKVAFNDQVGYIPKWTVARP